MAPKRYLIYLNKNTTGTLPSLEEQEALLVNKAEQEELNIIEVYKENSHSYTRFYQMLEAIEHGEADAVLVYDTEAFPKSVIAVGVLLLSFSENILALIKTFDTDYFHNPEHRKELSIQILRQ